MVTTQLSSSSSTQLELHQLQLNRLLSVQIDLTTEVQQMGRGAPPPPVVFV